MEGSGISQSSSRSTRRGGPPFLSVLLLSRRGRFFYPAVSPKYWSPGETGMIVFYDDACLLHDPPYEILDGQQVPYFETPARLRIIRHELEAAGFFDFRLSCSELDITKYLRMVHSEDYISYLETAYADWVADGGNKISVLPEAFHNSKLMSRGIAPDPHALGPIAKAGFYCFDLSCPITDTTYKSAIASLRVTLSAAEHLVSETKPHGSKFGLFALCRPPGHHAGTAICGGYCFINNVAVAARYLQSKIADPHGRTPIAILDIDYHHGNGTQEIFYEDPTVLYVSLHAQNDYPYYTGTKDERGSGDGMWFNHNFPLPRGTGDEEYASTLLSASEKIRKFNPGIVLVSLGVDTYVDDPISDFALTQEGYTRIGQIIATLDRPTLFVMEGGYHLESIGKNVRAVLDGFERDPPLHVCRYCVSAPSSNCHTTVP